MSIWSALTGLIQLFRFAKDMVVLWKQAKAEGWLSDAQATLDQIKGAKTDEERKALARRLAQLGMFPRS